MKCFKSFLVLIGLFVSSMVYAGPGLPVTLTAPTIPSSMTTSDSNTYTYTLHNSTSVNISVTALNITGNSESAAIASTCSTVPANGSCNFTVSITPTSGDITDGISDTVNVSYNGRGSAQLTSPIDISVSAGISATLTADRSVTTPMVSGTSQIITYTLTNTGSSALSGIVIDNPSSSAFDITSECAGTTLTPTSSCTFELVIAPEADNIGTISAQTIQVDYLSDTPLVSTTVGAITVTNPVLIATGTIASPGIVSYVYTSTDLGVSWTDITTNVSPDGFSDTTLVVAGGQTANGSGQLLNDTLLVGTNAPSSSGGYYLSNTNAGTLWSVSSTPSISTDTLIVSLGYGNLSGIPYFFTGLRLSANSEFGYSSNGSVITKTLQTAIDTTAPGPTGFGGGYYLMAINNAGGMESSMIYYTNNPMAPDWVQASGSEAGAAAITGIAYASIGSIDKWVFSTTDGNVHYSGTISGGWTGTTVSGSALRGIVYNSKLAKFVAVSSDGEYYTSPDGEGGTWSGAASIASDFSPQAITYSRSTGVMVVVGGNGKIYYGTVSSGVITWTQATGTGTVGFNSVASSTST